MSRLKQFFANCCTEFRNISVNSEFSLIKKCFPGKSESITMYAAAFNTNEHVMFFNFTAINNAVKPDCSDTGTHKIKAMRLRTQQFSDLSDLSSHNRNP